MNIWLSVARYQLTDRYVVLVSPWLILTIDFLINLVIVAQFPARQGHVAYTGGVAATYAVLLVNGALSISRQLPFALALGLSRRSYYIGTALLAVALAAVYGLILTVLQLIERASGGWGLRLEFFRVPYLLAGPWYLTWLTSFVGLALMLAWGMWFGIVYRRWNLVGLFSLLAAQALVLAVVLLIIGGLTGLLAAAAVALWPAGTVPSAASPSDPASHARGSGRGRRG